MSRGASSQGDLRVTLSDAFGKRDRSRGRRQQLSISAFQAALQTVNVELTDEEAAEIAGGLHLMRNGLVNYGRK